MQEKQYTSVFERMCKELESVPFPRARVKLGGRVSSYQVTQPLTYIFEPLTVAQIKGLLQKLFMYARCQHPQLFGHTKRSPCTFFDVCQR